MTTQVNGYTGTAKFLHWLVLVLLTVQFIVALTMEEIRSNVPPTKMISFHFMMGLIILAVVLIRLVWRLTHSAPKQLDDVPRWQAVTAHIVHWLLYGVLIAIPLLGWINASWRGFPLEMFGTEVPGIVGKRVGSWRWTSGVHTFLAQIVLPALVGLHIAAALYHRFVRKDGVLARMLPFQRG